MLLARGQIVFMTSILQQFEDSDHESMIGNSRVGKRKLWDGFRFVVKVILFVLKFEKIHGIFMTLIVLRKIIIKVLNSADWIPYLVNQLDLLAEVSEFVGV